MIFLNDYPFKPMLYDNIARYIELFTIVKVVVAELKITKHPRTMRPVHIAPPNF